MTHRLAPVLADSLRPTPRNLASAERAYTMLAVTGWTPLDGYPGSDTLWSVRCDLCSWTGTRFYSHLRRQRPKFRHAGCLPVDQHAARLAELTQHHRGRDQAGDSPTLPDGSITLDPEDNGHPCNWTGATDDDGQRIPIHVAHAIVPDPSSGAHVPVCRDHLPELLRPS